MPGEDVERVREAGEEAEQVEEVIQRCRRLPDRAGGRVQHMMENWLTFDGRGRSDDSQGSKLREEIDRELKKESDNGDWNGTL